MAIGMLTCFRMLLVILLLFLQSCASFQITGAPGGHNVTTGAWPSRQEINDFAQSGPAFDLYIQALSELQKTNQSDPLSYFQIAGIHGFPQIPWDGVNGSNPAYAGFCIHGALPFPTWHRPYLALMEQVIWGKAQTIAQAYPTEVRGTYQAAALTLRIPFWDWGIHPALPAAVQDGSITIRTPNGSAVVENPLYDYNFQGNADVNGFPRDRVQLADFPYTVRQLGLNASQSNQTAVNAELRANAGQLMSNTYTLFTQLTDYSVFSCIAPNGQANTGNNLEMLHGNIHNFVGGRGHMTWPEMAAFDPIFWLHHANVDRLFAMWQVLNPNSYFPTTGALNVYGSFYEPPGSIDSGSSQLAPFHLDNSTTIFTNDAVRSIAKFNYGYPDIPDWHVNGTQLKNYVRAQINAKYNPPMQHPRRRSLERPVSMLAAFSNIGFEDIKAFGVNNAEVQWTIRVDLDRYAYHTGFSLHFFLGPAPGDVREWPTAPNLVGTHSQFIASNVEAMFPAGKPKMSSRGEVSMTHSLVAGVDRGLLPSLSPKVVVPVIRDALTWRARTPDGCEVNLTKLEGLTIAVGSKLTTPTTKADAFPLYGPIIWHSEVTAGKVGGASSRRISRQSSVSIGPRQS